MAVLAAVLELADGVGVTKTVVRNTVGWTSGDDVTDVIVEDSRITDVTTTTLAVLNSPMIA